MEKELDPAIIKATQMSLGKYVKRPQLTDKLLRKPPFRFLHDIVTNIMKTTGFFEGLFEESELLSDNVKDRESKIMFLTKVITVLGLTTGETLKVKPSKIVAGQEPDKTNELLQTLAHALDNKLTSTVAVRKYKEGGTSLLQDTKKIKEQTKLSKKSNENNKLKSKSSEKVTIIKKEINKKIINEKDKINTNQHKQKQDNLTEESRPKPLLNSTTSKKSLIGNNNIIEAMKNDTSELGEENSPVQTTFSKKELEPKRDVTSSELIEEHKQLIVSSINSTVNTVNTPTIYENLQYPKDNIVTENFIRQESTALNDTSSPAENMKLKEESIIENKSDMIDQSDYNSNLTAQENENANDHEKTKNKTKSAEANPHLNSNVLRPKSTRPSSSRPGAPRLRDKHDNILNENENVLVGKVNIITENSLNEEEEESSLVVVEEKTTTEEAQDEHEQINMSENEQGHLVKQILDSQKEYSKKSGKTEIEWEFGAQKAREAVNKDIDQIKFDIQALSRVANPLGKLFDHIQEDVEVMRQELNQWTKTYEDTTKELTKQRAETEETLLPLHTKLKQLDTDILEKHDKINDLKIIIHKNFYRIEKLLSNGIRAIR
ncbi:hypothetical protein ACJJTC_001362 [Scirpophaga incertulas]